jgi:hypothetical protein
MKFGSLGKGKSVRRKTFALAACVAASALTIGTLAAFSSSAFAASPNAATNGTSHCDPSDPACGINPVRQGPLPPFVVVPANCPSFLSADVWTLDFVSGNAVSHGTSNKNGDWGGGTAEGQATLTTSDGVVQYAGHLVEWGGGGNNAAGQSVNGFTLTFNGSGIAGNLTIHADIHSTTNNSGTPTSGHRNVTVTCS